MNEKNATKRDDAGQRCEGEEHGQHDWWRNPNASPGWSKFECLLCGWTIYAKDQVLAERMLPECDDLRTKPKESKDSPVKHAK